MSFVVLELSFVVHFNLEALILQCLFDLHLIGNKSHVSVQFLHLCALLCEVLPLATEMRLSMIAGSEDLGPPFGIGSFIPPILIGTLGHLDYPELSRGESDDILPMLIVDAGGEWLGGLVVVAGLAALMSTMDSQLLATGSLFTRDILQSESKDGFGSRQAVIIGLSLLGLMLSLWSNVTILELGMLAFAMYAGIFPSVFIASYSDSLDGRAVIASIVAGELVVLLAIFSPGSFEGWW